VAIVPHNVRVSLPGPSVALNGVTKTYPGGTVAVDDVTVEIAGGSFVALVGSSGSGKSTLLKTINRLVEPESGAALLEGEDVRELEVAGLHNGIDAPANARFARVHAGARQLAAKLIPDAIFARLSLADIRRAGFACGALRVTDAEISFAADLPRGAAAGSDFSAC